jgi:hypothetical protein
VGGEHTGQRHLDRHGQFRDPLLILMHRLAWVLPLGFAGFSASALDIISSAPSDLIVTVYRAPFRNEGRFDLNALEGFALITETRTVHLPAGESRLRFEGVADGIEPASALVTGLPAGVIEKNRDARLLSPSALLARTLGKQVEVVRTNAKTGETQRQAGTLLSDEGGVVFKTEQGIEALRCSGLPETFDFEPVEGLSARPTLSVLVRTPTEVTRTVTLSYLSRGFDWAADYTATLSADGSTLDLGAWLTLANSNGVGFPSAHTQVVAGRVNREAGDAGVRPIDMGRPILARCWPRGTTSDIPMQLTLGGRTVGFAVPAAAMAMRSLNKASDALEEVTVTGTARQEQLGDLKLYRVPNRTTVASRQSKQVRLLDRSAIPVTTVYAADLALEQSEVPFPATRFLRTQNTAANNLGLPLPSGSVAVYQGQGHDRQLQSESTLRDLAAGQELEIGWGKSADVQVSQVIETARVDSVHTSTIPLVPGVLNLRSVRVSDIKRVHISNARSSAVRFELRLPREDRLVRADHPAASKDGRPIFLLTIPPRGSVTIRFQTAIAS